MPICQDQDQNALPIRFVAAEGGFLPLSPLVLIAMMPSVLLLPREELAPAIDRGPCRVKPSTEGLPMPLFTPRRDNGAGETSSSTPRFRGQMADQEAAPSEPRAKDFGPEGRVAQQAFWARPSCHFTVSRHWAGASEGGVLPRGKSSASEICKALPS